MSKMNWHRAALRERPSIDSRREEYSCDRAAQWLAAVDPQWQRKEAKRMREESRWRRRSRRPMNRRTGK